MSSLPISSPAAQGVLAEGVEEFLDALEEAPEVEPHSLMVLRHGFMVAAGWWWPYSAHRPHLLYSLSKIFTATAAGLAVADGRLRLDDPVIDYFPELRPKLTGSRAEPMLVRHLASMCTGHTEDTAAQVFTASLEDPVLNFLLLPPEQEPGSVFCYNQPATYTLAAIVQRVTGETLAHYLQKRLFDKLGTGKLRWLQDPTGRDIGYSGLYATTDTVARLGQLYLQGGEWEGQQLLPRSWVSEATRAQVRTGLDGPDGAWYGYQFRMSQHGYRGDGAYGQYCLVLPDEDAVVVMTAQTRQRGPSRYADRFDPGLGQAAPRVQIRDPLRRWRRRAFASAPGRPVTASPSHRSFASRGRSLGGGDLLPGRRILRRTAFVDRRESQFWQGRLERHTVRRRR